MLVWALIPLFDRMLGSLLDPDRSRSSVLVVIVAALCALLLIFEPSPAGSAFFAALAAISSVGLIVVSVSNDAARALRAFRVTTWFLALAGLAAWWVLVT